MKRKRVIKGFAVFFAIFATIVGGVSVLSSIVNKPKKIIDANFHKNEKND